MTRRNFEKEKAELVVAAGADDKQEKNSSGDAGQ